MLSERQRQLEAAAKRVAAAARTARTWIGEVRGSAASVGNEADSLIGEARRTENLARKLTRAAARRMCVGVYGASQQGKSYLVSVLARPPGQAELLARFGSGTRDFVKEINPQGGKESTGLVTRFTTDPGEGPADPDFPVELRLLSETDIVKILANSFQSDFDQNNVALPVPRGDEIRERVAACEKERQTRVMAPHLDDIVLTDVGEYFQKNFYNRWQELNPIRYWDRLIELAPHLPLEARAALFSILWGGIEDFTSLYRLLVGALEQLGHAEEAVTEMKSLIPRDTSIIDVGTLLAQLGTERDAQDQLLVKTRRDGSLAGPVGMPRALLTALVAELRITMHEKPWPLFEHTDLLDFPGARSRFKLSALPTNDAERASQIRELLLRGKVAYLFQRYAEERELTAMLLCMGNKPNEVKDLGTMVRQWIELTHGANPEARRAVPVSLFLVLTMLDLEFLPRAGETDDAIAKKWNVRLHTSLLEPYRHDGWPENFAGAPFDNTVLLRNPNFVQDHLVEYRRRPGTNQREEPLVEIGVSENNRDYIEKARQAFFGSEVVAKHVGNPREAWEAMFALNDGGVGYIVAKLAAVSDPSMKNRQVEQRLREGSRGLHANLKRFYYGVDEDARREKEEALRGVRRALQMAFQPKRFRTFPRFLSYLTVSERDIREIVLNVAALKIDDAAPPDAATELVDIFASPGAAGRAPDLARLDDRPACLARELHRHWIAQLRRLPQDEPLLQHFGLEARALNDLVDQLVVSADRLKLVERVAERVRAATHLAAMRWDEIADRVVTIASQSFNIFVAELGFHEVPLAQRPGFPEGDPEPERRVFAPPPAPPRDGLPVLGDAPESVEIRYFVDWGVAFLQAGIANLSYGGGRELNEQQNAALGDILGSLAIDRHLAPAADQAA